MDRLRLVCMAGAVIEVFASVDALPADATGLLADAARDDFQLGAAWFRTVAAHARPEGARPMFLLHRQAGRAAALLPLWRARGGAMAMTSPYTCLFRPLLAEGADAMSAGRAFGVACRAHGPLRLDALDPAWPALPALLAGLRRAGLVALRFDHFGNWTADIAGLDWAAYLAGRPGELRETIRRRLARAARDPATTFEMVADGPGLDAAIVAYEAVYARSWKGAEPFPEFTAAAMRAAADAGVLRLGLLRQDGVPVAAQYWSVTGGTARVEKLAHDAEMKRLSPGTVLTARTISHLIAHDRVTSLDFGRGDDGYKAGWTGQRRARIGVLLCPPWHPAGAAAIGRHLAGRLRKRVGSSVPDG